MKELGRESLKQEERLESGQLVVDILHYEGSSERMIGYRKLQEAGLITPNPIFVLTHSAFEEYQGMGMTEKLQTEILDAFHQIREKNPHRGVFLGWRTVLPGGELPPGPRTAAVYDEKEYLDEVERFWQEAKKNYDIEGAEIVFVLHPFIHPAQEPIPERSFLWAGGAVVPLPNDRIIIQATYGPDEAVQGYKCDEYSVQIKKDSGKISWQIAHKPTTLKPHKGKYVETTIPPLYQNQQVLSLTQVREIAEAHQKVTQAFGLHRLEFIVQPEGVVFRECAPFDVKPEDFFFLEGELIQPVILINSEKDIKRVKPPSAIAHYPAELYQDRSIVPISSLLASHAKERKITLVVLAHGLITTQHMVRRHRDFEQSVLFTEDNKLEEGEEVRVFRSKDGIGRWERVEKEQNNIINLKDTKAMQKAAPKARNLSILGERGVRVPNGFYLTESLFKQHLASLGLEQAVKELYELSGEKLRQQCEKIQRTILESELPGSLKEQVQERLKQLPDGKSSVRSAETHEDEATALAGLFKSFIGVAEDVVSQKILECWASAFSYHTIEYARTSGIAPSEIEMGVLIQEMIEGKGGVMYAGEKIAISAGKSPEAITSGTEKRPHNIEVKKKGEILREEVHPEGQILSKKEIEQLVALGLQIKEIFARKPQDIEWVIDDKGKIVILQARPLPY